MSNEKTPLFLDVDGVLNVFPANRHRGLWDDFVTEPVETFGRVFDLTISRTCCDALVGLNVDIQWLTTWGDEANAKLQGLTGFEDFPVLAEMPFRARVNWKHAAVINWYKSPEGQKRFIWIDDDAIPSRAEHEFPEALLIRTDFDEGITPEHIKLIGDYCI